MIASHPQARPYLDHAGRLHGKFRGERMIPVRVPRDVAGIRRRDRAGRDEDRENES